MVTNLNTILFTAINGWAGSTAFFDIVFIAITSYCMYGIFFLVGLYIAAYLPMVTKNVFLRITLFVQALEIGVAVLSTWIVVKCIKVAVALPRPFEVLPHTTVLAPIQGGTSFPSGHSALTMALAVAVYYYHPRLGKLLVLFSLLVALSRIVVGVHYPLDIAVGLLLGYGVPVAIHTLFKFVKIAPGEKKA